MNQEALQKIYKFISENEFDDKQYSEFLRSLPINIDDIGMLSRKNGKTENLIWLMRAYTLQKNPDLTICDLLERERIARAIINEIYED